MSRFRIILPLAEQIKTWWPEHQHDVCGDYNLFEDEPVFVQMAEGTASEVELAVAIVKWWKEHRYDTCGPRGDYNVFSSIPDFVDGAFHVLGIDEASLDHWQEDAHG